MIFTNEGRETLAYGPKIFFNPIITDIITSTTWILDPKMNSFSKVQLYQLVN